MAEKTPDHFISRGGQNMNLKDLIFGGGVKSGGDGGTYRDSIQAWLPIKNIIGGVVITKDGRFVKILELLPVNIYLKSPNDRRNIISSFAAYLKIAPNDLQMVARTLPADTQAYVEQMQRYAEKEDNEACREMIEDNIQEIGNGIASDAMRHRFFLVFQYEASMRAKEDGISLRLNAAALFRRVERVRYAAEKGCLDRRPQSACVQFREDRVFSLDGRRMACDTQPDTVFPVPCLLLGDALTHLRAFGENEVAVQIGAHKVCFSDETLKLYVRRYGVDTYDPDVAIPKAYREVITVQTDELLRELTYLKECIGSCTFPYVRFAGQELSMNVPSGRFTTRVSMVGRGDLAIGFNLRYMLDVLKQFRKEPTVRIKLSGPYTPIVVEAEGRSDFALVLPVRLRDEMAA